MTLQHRVGLATSRVQQVLMPLQLARHLLPFLRMLDKDLTVKVASFAQIVSSTGFTGAAKRDLIAIDSDGTTIQTPGTQVLVLSSKHTSTKVQRRLSVIRPQNVQVVPTFAKVAGFRSVQHF